jgi:Protein of unknown function (DUF3108)
MKRHGPALALALAAAAALWAPADAQRAVPRREPEVPFKVGETLTYDVTYSSYLVAGTATAVVKDKSAASTGPSAYHIVAEGRPIPLLQRVYNLYYKMDAMLDAVSLLSQRSTLHVEEGSRLRTATTTFDRAKRRAVYEIQAGAPVRQDFAVPGQVQDGLSALYSLRTTPLKTGQRLTMPVADDGALYTVSLDVGQVERLRVPLGESGAWNIKVAIANAEGKAVGSNAAVWISNDARRLPLKLQADLPVGSFVLLLRDAR